VILWPSLITITHVLGVLSAVRAIMDARTAQGAIAWAIALIAFPYLALPLFWIFGKRKFVGYVIERRDSLSEANPIAQQAHKALVERGLLVQTDHARELPFERLAKLPFTTGNDAELLIDGNATFASIFAGIENARDYVLVQDLQELIKDALRHRMVLSYEALAEQRSADSLLDEVIAAVAVPALDLSGKAA